MTEESILLRHMNFEEHNSCENNLERYFRVYNRRCCSRCNDHGLPFTRSNVHRMKKIILFTTILILASCRSETDENECVCNDHTYIREFTLSNGSTDTLYTSDWFERSMNVRRDAPCADNGKETAPEKDYLLVKINGDKEGRMKKTITKCYR